MHTIILLNHAVSLVLWVVVDSEMLLTVTIMQIEGRMLLNTVSHNKN